MGIISGKRPFLSTMLFVAAALGVGAAMAGAIATFGPEDAFDVDDGNRRWVLSVAERCPSIRPGIDAILADGRFTRAELGQANELIDSVRGQCDVPTHPDSYT